MSARLLVAAAAMSATAAAHGQTLWQAWQAAAAHDPEFRAARAALRAAQAAHPQALAALLPQLGAGANRTFDNQSSSGPQFYGSQIVPLESSANTRATGWQVQLTQTLFDWSAIKNLQAADLDAAAAAATYQSTFAGLASKVANAYLGVLSAQANLAVAEGTAKAFAEQYRQAEARYKAGLSGIIGAESSQAALASAQADVLDARKQFDAARNTLAALTGAPAGGAFPRLPLDYPVTAAGSMDDWLGRAYTHNPALAAAKLTARADAARIGAADSGYIPTLSLALTHSHYSQSGTSDYAVPGNSVRTPAAELSSDNTIELQLSWSIFSGGATRAAVERAGANADQAAADAATTRLDVEREVKTRYAAIANDSDVIARLRTAVTAARAAVAATERAVPAGVRTEDDLVTQRERLFTAQTGLDAAVAAAVQDQIALARAAGELTPERIRALSAKLAAGTSEPVPHSSGAEQ